MFDEGPGGEGVVRPAGLRTHSRSIGSERPRAPVGDRGWDQWVARREIVAIDNPLVDADGCLAKPRALPA